MKKIPPLKRCIGPLALVCVLLSLPFAAFGETAPTPTDYFKAAHWLSLPAPLKAVDVFYLYPTAWLKTEQDGVVCEIDNAIMRKGAPAAYGRQAAAFEPVGNVFAPYYRQATLLKTDREKVMDGIPAHDALAAFDHYIKHFNNGRPFLLAGHSQGSHAMLKILSVYMKANPEVYARMLAAYVVGYSVDQPFLDANPHLKFAEGPDDLGVVVSYNTQAPVVEPGEYPPFSGLVINPITWTRDETPAAPSQSLGSFMPDSTGKTFSTVAHFAGARVDVARGVLICEEADADALFRLSGGFGKGVYHSFDYSFYFYNLRANAANRVEKFLARAKNGR